MSVIFNPEILIIIFSVLTSVLFSGLFIAGFNKRSTIKAVLFDFTRKINRPNKARKNYWIENVELLMDENEGLKIFGFKIRTIENFFILRIIFSISIFLVIIILGYYFNKNLYLHAAACALIAFRQCIFIYG